MASQLILIALCVQKNQFAEDVARAGSVLPLRTAFPTILALGAYFPFIPFFNDIVQSRQRILAVQEKRVARYLELVEAGNSERSKTLFGALVKKGNAADLSPMDLTVEVQSYITAGTDTTAVTLTYLVWAVCQDKEIQETLVRELQSLPESLTHADIRELPYLNRVIDEALRCYGAAPGALPRDVPAAGANLAGHYIPAGIVVSTQAYSVHRDPKIFPDPDRCVPIAFHLFNSRRSYYGFLTAHQIRPIKVGTAYKENERRLHALRYRATRYVAPGHM